MFGQPVDNEERAGPVHEDHECLQSGHGNEEIFQDTEVGQDEGQDDMNVTSLEQSEYRKQ